LVLVDVPCSGTVHRLSVVCDEATALDHDDADRVLASLSEVSEACLLVERAWPSVARNRRLLVQTMRLFGSTEVAPQHPGRAADIVWAIRSQPVGVRNAVAMLALRALVQACSGVAEREGLVPLLEEQFVSWVRPIAQRRGIQPRLCVSGSAVFSSVNVGPRGLELCLALRDLPSLVASDGAVMVDRLLDQGAWPLAPLLHAIDLSDAEGRHRLSFPRIGDIRAASCSREDPPCAVCQYIAERLIGTEGTGQRPEFMLHLWDQDRLSRLRADAQVGSAAGVRRRVLWDALHTDLRHLLHLPPVVQRRVALLAMECMAAGWWATGRRPVGLEHLTEIVRSALEARLGAARQLDVEIGVPFSSPHLRSTHGRRSIAVPLDLVPCLLEHGDLSILEPVERLASDP
jgi:hypothetical protein